MYVAVYLVYDNRVEKKIEYILRLEIMEFIVKLGINT